MNKLRLLKISLILGAVYYFIGAIAHYFGLTLFPFYDAKLYSSYHDSLIALTNIVLVLILLAVARDPIKNKDILNVVILSVFLASIFSIALIWKINFDALGASAKKMQTIFEGVLGLVYGGVLVFLSLGTSPCGEE